MAEVRLVVLLFLCVVVAVAGQTGGCVVLDGHMFVGFTEIVAGKGCQSAVGFAAEDARYICHYRLL